LFLCWANESPEDAFTLDIMNFIDCANEGKKQASVSKKRRFIRTLKKFNVPFQTFLRASNKITACKKKKKM
jgi:hypothetical protein